MHQTSTTKRLKCVCGNKMQRYACVSLSPCSICAQQFDIGSNELYWCFKQACEFERVAGYPFTMCCECFENIPSNQTLEQRLSFALQTTKSIIQQKTQAQEPINTYLCYLKDTGGIYLTIDGYLKHQLIPSALKDEFDGVYESALKHIEEAIVVNQLALHPDVLRTTEKEEGKTDGIKGDEWKESQKETQIKWFNLHQSVSYSGMNKDIVDYDVMHECTDVEHCISCLRVSFVLDLYGAHVIQQEHEQKESDFMEIFNQCLLSYRLTNVINDFIHILEYHHNEQDLAHLNEGEVIKLCTNEECGAEQRRYNDDDEVFNDHMGAKDNSVHEMMDLLHSYFAHQNGTMNNNDRRNNGRMIGSKRGGKATHNKFATYIDTNEAEVPPSSQPESPTASSTNAPSSKQQVNAFSFGAKFLYWPYFKNKPDEYIKTPNHASLKDELLKNNIYTITMTMFNKYILQALDYARCKRAKAMESSNLGSTNKWYDIPVGLHLTMPHLLVLMLYTNMTTLQFKFKKHGTRKLHHTESVADIKRRNMEIANWFKLLYEVVLFFGERPKSSDLFYHGISVKLYFSEFAPIFKAPISTTKSITVAQQFADGGIIIALTLAKAAAYNAQDRYLAVRWLSRFPEEDEYFFTECKQLYIVDIRECERSLILLDNTYFLMALRLFDELFKGNYFIFGLKKKKFTQRLLFKLIAVSEHVIDQIYKELNETDMRHSDIVSLLQFLASNDYESDSILADLGLAETRASNIQKYLAEMALSSAMVGECLKTLRYWYDGISPYIMELFCHLVSTKAQQSVLYVVESDFRFLTKQLQSALLKQKNGHNVLFGDNACKVSFLTEYIWSLDENEFAKLVALKKGEDIWSESYSYYLSEIDERITFKLNLETHMSPEPHLMGFYIYLTSYPKDQVIQCDWCLAVDELKWCVNGWSDTFDKNQNWSAGKFAFAHRLLQNDNVSCLTIRLSVRFRVQ
eukprot:446325_1